MDDRFDVLQEMKKSVLFLTRSLQSGCGGMQLHARTLLSGLRMRQDITLTVVGYGGNRFGLLFFLPYALLRSLCTTADFVHAGDAVLSLLFPVLYVLRPRITLSVAVHGLDLTYPHSLYQRLLRRSLSHAHRVVCNSTATAARAHALGVVQEKILVIPPAVLSSDFSYSTHFFAEATSLSSVPEKEMSVFKGNSGPLLAGALERRSGGEGREGARFLLLGRQIKRKGTVWFLSEVFPQLLREIPEITVTIAGDGPELLAIRDAIRTHQLQDSVRLFGCVTEETKHSLYAESTLFLMPNIPVSGDMEGFGLVCLEAASCGLPVVAAKLEGIVDAVVEDETGLFFLPQNADDCIRVIKKALAIQWHQEAIKDVCRQKFNFDSMLSSYLTHVWR